VQTQPADLGNH